MSLLSKLRSRLSAYLCPLEKFVAIGGDHEYFLNMKFGDAVLANDSIKESFTLFTELQKRLETLYISSQEDATIVRYLIYQGIFHTREVDVVDD
jgi:hypothetical protein